MIGIVDPWSGAIVRDVLRVATDAGAVTAAICETLDDDAAGGPGITGTFAPLGWIVAGQVLALALARRAGIDSDAPRGLRKFSPERRSVESMSRKESFRARPCQPGDRRALHLGRRHDQCLNDEADHLHDIDRVLVVGSQRIL